LNRQVVRADHFDAVIILAEIDMGGGYQIDRQVGYIDQCYIQNRLVGASYDGIFRTDDDDRPRFLTMRRPDRETGARQYSA